MLVASGQGLMAVSSPSHAAVRSAGDHPAGSSTRVISPAR
jgi:hypothetical protein